MSETIQVAMLGGFSICWNGRTLDDSSNRMRKVWLLLAYLIYARNSRATQENYLALLQNAGGAEAEDPVGRLKASFYRVRTMRNQLDDTAGHQLIIRRNGHYAWNTEVPLAWTWRSLTAFAPPRRRRRAQTRGLRTICRP